MCGGLPRTRGLADCVDARDERALARSFSTINHPRHLPPHLRPHELAEPLILQRPPKHHLRLNPILNGVPIRVPHEHVDRREEVWLRGARGDSALLVGGGVEQDPAQEPGEFVTEGVRAPTPPITANPFSHAVPSSARIARLT